MAQSNRKESDEAGEWALHIDSYADAQRYANLSGWVGFFYAALTTLLALFALKMGIGQMLQLDALEAKQASGMTMGLAMLFARFIVYTLLSWLNHTRAGRISAPLLLLMFMIEHMVILLGSIKSGFVPGILDIILTISIGYVLYAGVRGTWAKSRFARASHNRAMPS